MKQRSRPASLAALLGVIVLGLASRKYHVFAGTFGKYPGDALWALMVYLMVGLLWPRLDLVKTALAAVLFSIGIETFKLAPAPALVHARSTAIGGLILGHEFSWNNLVAYGLGIAVGAGGEAALRPASVDEPGAKSYIQA